MNRTSQVQSELIQGLNGINLRTDLLDDIGFDVDTLEVATILTNDSGMDHQLYAEFPYLYHSHGHVTDPDRLGVIVNLIS